MRRTRFVWAVLALTLALPVPRLHAAEPNRRLGLGMPDAPPPPIIQIVEEPRVVVVPGTTVNVVEDERFDFDYFRYGVYWYIHRDGFWYRARSHRGPFRSVEVRYVPKAVIGVPAKHWKHPHDGPASMLTKEKGRDR